MGQVSCSLCSCNHQDKEAFSEVEIDEYEGTRQRLKTHLKEQVLHSNRGYLKNIVKIQAAWRGYFTRRTLQFSLNAPKHHESDTKDSFSISAQNPVSVLTREFGKLVFAFVNDGRYEGDFKDNAQDGFGIERWADGSTYQGFYMQGMKHGFGKYVWFDGSSYVGQWIESKINGFGCYTWVDGRKYQGEWLNNSMHGYGVHSWSDGRKYEGEYRFDKKHGQGTYTWTDGKKYVGGWKEGKQHGNGAYVFPNGKTKHYYWREGKRCKILND